MEVQFSIVILDFSYVNYEHKLFEVVKNMSDGECDSEVKFMFTSTHCSTMKTPSLRHISCPKGLTIAKMFCVRVRVFKCCNQKISHYNATMKILSVYSLFSVYSLLATIYF